MRGEDNEGILAVAEGLGLVVIEAVPSPDCCGVFEMSDGLAGEGGREDAPPRGREGGHQQRDDVAMVLHVEVGEEQEGGAAYGGGPALRRGVHRGGVLTFDRRHLLPNQMPALPRRRHRARALADPLGRRLRVGDADV